MNRIFLVLSLFLSFTVNAQILPGVVAASKSYTIVEQSPEIAHPLTFGDTLGLWIDFTSAEGKTLSGNGFQTISGITSNDSSFFVFDGITGANRNQAALLPGKSSWAQNNAVYINASTSNFNWLHDGTTPWTIVIRFAIPKSNPNDRYTIFSNNNATAASRGITFAWDDRTSSSRNDALALTMSNGTSAILGANFNNAVPSGVVSTTLEPSYRTVILTYDGTTLTAYVDNTTPIGTATRSGSPSTSNAGQNMYLLGQQNGSFFNKGMLLKQFYIVKKVLTLSQITEALDFCDNGSEVYGIAGSKKEYVLIGQSNIRGNVGSPYDADLGPTIKQPVLSWHRNTTKQNYVDTLQYQYNNNANDAGTSNQVGPVMRFANLMGNAHDDIAVLSDGRGGTSLYAQSASLCWNVGVSGSLIHSAIGYVISSINYDIPYCTDYSATLNGVVWGQGETDSNCLNGDGVTDPDYANNLEDLIKLFVDDVTAAGISTENAPWIIMRVHNNFSPARPCNTNVRTDQTYVVDNFRTDFPAYADKVPSLTLVDTDDYDLETDLVHFKSTTGMTQWGTDIYNIFNSYYEKTYVPIPSPPTFSDTHTLVQATTGNGIQIGDTGGKQQFRVSGNYPFMQFNIVNSDDYSITSFDNSAPANWSVIGSPSPNDYSIDNINASHGLSLYRLRFEGSDNLIKWNGTDTTLTLKEILIENCIFRNAGFGGILINQNVAGDGYGKFTSRFNSFTGGGSERHYLGRTGSGSVQKYMDTTRIAHCFMDSSAREAVQCNNHKYVMIENITSLHGGQPESPDQGIGQKNFAQLQGIGAGYFKNSIGESTAPMMIASTGIDILNNRITWTQTDRPIYFQDVDDNDYHYKNVGDDTVKIEGNDFICDGYTETYVLWLQEKNCHYVIRNNRFPPSATSIYRVDGAAPLSITVSGNTFDSDQVPPVTFQNHPDADYADYWKVVTSDYDYNKGRGALTP